MDSPISCDASSFTAGVELHYIFDAVVKTTVMKVDAYRGTLLETPVTTKPRCDEIASEKRPGV